MVRQNGAASSAYTPQQIGSSITSDFDLVHEKLLAEDELQSERLPATMIFKALEDPNWDWRTLAGIGRDTGLEESVITDVLDQNQERLEFSQSEEFGRLVRLKTRKVRPTQLITGMLDIVLDILSLGKRSIVQS